MASALASREMGTDEDKSTLKPSQQDGAVGTGKLPGHCTGHQAEGLLEERVFPQQKNSQKGAHNSY